MTVSDDNVVSLPGCEHIHLNPQLIHSTLLGTYDPLDIGVAFCQATRISYVYFSLYMIILLYITAFGVTICFRTDEM